MSGRRKFAHYIHMKYLGCINLVGSVSEKKKMMKLTLYMALVRKFAPKIITKKELAEL